MIKIKEAAEILGISTKTLRNWEKEGKIKSYKTLGNHRRYEKEYIEKFKKEYMMR